MGIPRGSEAQPVVGLITDMLAAKRGTPQGGSFAPWHFRFRCLLPYKGGLEPYRAAS